LDGKIFLDFKTGSKGNPTLLSKNPRAGSGFPDPVIISYKEFDFLSVQEPFRERLIFSADSKKQTCRKGKGGFA
jgi:hypothetical protein